MYRIHLVYSGLHIWRLAITSTSGFGSSCQIHSWLILKVKAQRSLVALQNLIGPREQSPGLLLLAEILELEP